MNEWRLVLCDSPPIYRRTLNEICLRKDRAQFQWEDPVPTCPSSQPQRQTQFNAGRCQWCVSCGDSLSHSSGHNGRRNWIYSTVLGRLCGRRNNNIIRERASLRVWLPTHPSNRFPICSHDLGRRIVLVVMTGWASRRCQPKEQGVWEEAGKDDFLTVMLMMERQKDESMGLLKSSGLSDSLYYRYIRRTWLTKMIITIISTAIIKL